MTTIRDALKPFKDFADPRSVIPADYVITRGSSIARTQLTMGDCYRARAAYEQSGTDDLIGIGSDQPPMDQASLNTLIASTQDLSMPETIRKVARATFTINALRTQPPQTLPAFFTQDEVLTLIELITAKLCTPQDEAIAARLRAARKALAPIFCGAPDPEAVDRPLRWDRPQGAKKGECFVDVPGVGRYLIRRSAPGAARGFVATLNGKSTSFSGPKSEDVVAMVERSVRAQRMGSKP